MSPQRLSEPQEAEIAKSSHADSPMGYWDVVGIVVTLVIFLLAFFVLAFVMAIPSGQESARRMSCNSNLKMLSLAFHNYHDTYQSFPPAYTVDDEGNPLHSWRVLILPYVEQQALYEEIRLDEPWDSAHNSDLHQRMPSIFACPSCRDHRKEGLTVYRMIIGPDTISDGPNSVTIGDMTRGASNTVLLVETTQPVCWMEPSDLPVSALALGVVSAKPRKGTPPLAVGSVHKKRGGFFSPNRTNACAAMADGSVTYLEDSMIWGTLPLEEAACVRMPSSSLP